MTKEQFVEYMKPIASRMFGKQSPYRMKEERFVVRPVGLIVEDLCKIADDEWAKYAFSREPLNGKFNDTQRVELTRQALACGAEAARQCIEQYGARDSLTLGKKMGLTIDYPMMPQNSDRVLFAEFREPNLINVFMDGVKKAEQLLSEPGVSEALGHDLYLSKLLIAHELFHYVEEKHKKEIWTQTYKIELWAPKPLHNRSKVAVLSEIAAMGFAKELTQLAYSPYVMDAFMVYGYTPEAASALYEEMMKFAGKTPRFE